MYEALKITMNARVSVKFLTRFISFHFVFSQLGVMFIIGHLCHKHIISMSSMRPVQ